MQQNQSASVYSQAEDAGEQSLPLDLMIGRLLGQAPTAAFDALLDQADPQATVPVSAEARANRRLCGRWLVVQRLRLGLSSSVVAERVGVDEPMVRLLESGLTTEIDISDAVRAQLSYLLADAERNPSWMRDLLSITIGRPQAQEAQVLQQVTADLAAPRIDPRASGLQDDGYELFRRAIVGRDEEAWAEIYTRYRPLLIAWAQHSSAAANCDENPADLADQAFARAWVALSPESFAQFPSLAALLAYLRTCVKTVVIDMLRAQASRERIQSVGQPAMLESSEQIVLATFDNTAIWQAVAAQLATHAERVILIECCIYDLPPRAILARHPTLFADIAAVYAAKRNLFNRLQRNSALQQLQSERHSHA